MRILLVLLAFSLPLLSLMTSSAEAQQSRLSNAAAYLLNEQLGVACQGRGGTLDPSAFIERDFTGDGKTDLLIDHRGFRCNGKPSSSYECGMQACSMKIYVREGKLLRLKWDALAMQPEIGAGHVPVIRVRGHGGTPGAMQWNGSSFVPARPTPAQPMPVKTSQPPQVAQSRDPEMLKHWLLAEAYLQQLGFDPGRTDGQVDASTFQAVEKFQRTYGLEVNGTLSPEHFKLLEALVLAKTSGATDANNQAPAASSEAAAYNEFSDYPAADRLTSAPVYPDFSGRDSDYATYRSRIRDGVSGGVNFAGHYSFVTIGCGTECRFGFAVDLQTGEVFDFPYGGEEQYQMDLRFNADSRLIRVRWKGDWQSETCTEKDLVVEGTDWRILAERTVPTVDDLCFFPFDQ